MTEQPKPTVEQLISEYLGLRTKKKVAEDKIKEFFNEQFNNRMDAIEADLHSTLDAIGAQNIKTELGTAYKRTVTSITTADKSVFREYVLENRAWDMIEWRGAKTAINDWVGDGNALPPGLNYTQHIEISINAAKD